MNEPITRTAKFLQDAAQEAVRSTVHQSRDTAHQDGFSRAAAVTLRVIEDTLDTFTTAMRGPGLSKPDQATYVRLTELKAEIEASYDRYWQNTALSWRLPQPVARAVLRKDPDPGSS